MALPEEIIADLNAHADAALEQYRTFHRHPELSMDEHQTAARIEDVLRACGLSPFRCAGTGVVAVIANGPGPVVAFRADTDGLPIAEDTGLDYASMATAASPDGEVVPVMHGCGHDTHITVALQMARLLTAHRDAWHGTVVMLFQPGEEIVAGARGMVDDGLWQKVPRPEAVYGQHVWPSVAGGVELSVGTAMSMGCSLRVTVHGRQAHGSQPENSIDALLLGAYMVTRLQSVVSREIAATRMGVVTVGTFHSGLKDNIIPATAQLGMTVRAFEPEVLGTLVAAIGRVVRGEAAASGAPAPEIERVYDIPRCFNDEDETRAVVDRLRAELGDDQVVVRPPVTGSEDFGVFADSLGVPGVFWFFGAFTQDRLDAGDVPGNHSPFFAPDDPDTTLRTGVRAGLAALWGRIGR